MIKAYYINSTQALYDDSEFAWLQSLILEEGVLGDSGGTMGLQVIQNTPVQDMNVIVGVGKALVEITKSGRTFKVLVENDAAVTVPIAANGGGSNRVDAIIVRVDVDTEPNVLKNNVATIERIAGDDTSPLEDSDITAAVGSDGWYRLADVTVEPAETQILTADIVDARAIVELNDAVRISLDALQDLDTSQGAIDQEQTGSASSTAVGGTNTAGGRRRVAQSFIAARKGIRSAFFYKKANTGTFTGDIAFSVQADVAGEPSGTPLASYTMGNAEYNALSNDAEFEVLFDAQYSPFTEGATYWLVAIPTTGDNGNCANFGAATGSPYANGNMAYYNGDDGWVDVSGTDLYFKVRELTAEQLVRTDENGNIPSVFFGSKIVRTYTTPGNYTWKKEGKLVLVEVWGGGGGGGGRNGGSSTWYGAGGGGGAYLWKIIDTSTLPGNVTVTVGAGGAGSSGTGSNGGQSQFNNNAFTNNFGYGGEGSNSWGGGGGGSANDGSPVGAGGNNSDATLAAMQYMMCVPFGTRSTNSSFKGFVSGIYSGAGGSGNSTSWNAHYGGNSMFGGGGGGGRQGGIGGNSMFAGKGGNGADGSVVVTGEDGYYPSGGGGGGAGNNAAPRVGGNGANGMVRITIL